MTEKHYGGSSGFGFKEKPSNSVKSASSLASSKNIEKSKESIEILGSADEKSLKNLVKAGKIAQEAIIYAKSFIKQGMLLSEIAEKIESKIKELGGSPAFPVNLSINEVAAHSTPLPNSSETAYGLLKVDIGVHISGFVADTAFSLDLENSQENKKLIESAEKALKEACSLILEKKGNTKLREIGNKIETEIKKSGFTPIQNLSGHLIEQYELHAGISIPNYDNAQEKSLGEGVYAIEPFSTTGLGKVRDGRPSSIYSLSKESNARDSFARSVLNYIKENYNTLPFCTRWLHKEFGSRVSIALQQLEQAGIIHQYPQLIESGKGKVAQAENTIIVSFEKAIVTTA